jgi:hypothetical protein
MPNIDVSRNDLLPLDQVPDWKGQYPVGGKVTLPHIETGADTVYTVLTATVDNHPTFHPSTNQALYRCSALLRPVTP